jgi:hypothetical protein
MRSTVSMAVGASLLFLCAQLAAGAPPYQQLWAQQFGTGNTESAQTIAVSDSGNYFITGSTYGNLAAPNAGFDDSFLRALSPGEQTGWTVQLGTGDSERYQSVATSNGSVYFLTGMEQGAASGMPGIYRYSESGALQSTSVTGFPNLGSELDTSSITVDAAGSVYVVGSIHQDHDPVNSFIAKINSQGATQWYQLTNSVPRNFEKLRVAVDQNGFAYALQTVGAPGNTQVQLNKYSSTGQLQWSRSYGAPGSDSASDLSLDLSGNPVVVGAAYGNFGAPQAGGGDVFVFKTDGDGNMIWVKQFGDAAGQEGAGVAVAPNGHIFVGGIDWVVPNVFNSVNSEAFWSELDSAGNLLWTTKFGTANTGDGVLDVLVDNGGDVVLVGQTYGSLFSQNHGNIDAFAVKFDVNAIPEPSALALIALAVAVLSPTSSFFGRRRWH